MVDTLLSVPSYIVPFLIVLTGLVFVHEMGHYLAARLNGVRVEIFSIGFGPELFGWNDRTGTRWKFSAIPLGGYVKMFGDRDGSSAPDGGTISEMTPEEREVAFHCKSLRQRTVIVAAGPVANFVLAAFIFAGLYSLMGQPYTSPELASVDPDSAAAEAGLQPGDRIVEIGGRSVDRFEDVQLRVQMGLGDPVEIVVMRSGERLSVTAVPEVVEYTDRFGNTSQMGRLGIRSSKIELRRLDPVTAVGEAIQSTYDYTVITLKAVGQFISGERSTREMAGPIGIAKMSGDMAQAGILGILWFMAVLSINLGLINLFPIPVLDGGHLLFYAYEAVRGRPLGERAQEYGFRFGLGLVLLLMIFVTWNDLANLVGRLMA